MYDSSCRTCVHWVGDRVSDRVCIEKSQRNIRRVQCPKELFLPMALAATHVDCMRAAIPLAVTCLNVVLVDDM